MLIDFFVTFFALYYFSNKTLIEIGKSTYTCMLSSSAYYAITTSVQTEYKYSDIIKIHKNSDGEISMITANSYKVNSLSSSLANSVMSYLESETKKGVDVPLGVFTGVNILSGFGKKVKMPLITVTSVKCDIVSCFEEAGINQTRHAVYVDIIPEVNIVTRTKTEKMLDTIRILLFDN
ncbi:MAG: hypothetical protein J6R88_05810, partial [Clostridia bacterium]|nr:hypothetical protein [Clostridia bacterium]